MVNQNCILIFIFILQYDIVETSYTYNVNHSSFIGTK
jgi:hypothetical protein